MTIREKGSLGTEGWELIFKERLLRNKRTKPHN